MRYWILKTEPETYSFKDLVRDKETSWDGIRNYLARNNLRLMSVGDIAVIYESVGPKSAVGTARILKQAFQDPTTEQDWSSVVIQVQKPFKVPVTLAQMKSDKILKEMALVKNSRISVSPLTAAEFKRLVELGS